MSVRTGSAGCSQRKMVMKSGLTDSFEVLERSISCRASGLKPASETASAVPMVPDLPRRRLASGCLGCH
jgi:hypothetical protein